MMSIPPAIPKPPPARGWYVAAGILAAVAMATGAFVIVSRIGGLADRLQQVVVPGQAEINLSEVGTYTIFNEYNSVVDGKIYRTPASSGLRVEVLTPRRQTVPLSSPTATSRYSFSGRAGVSVLSFTINEPGIYRLNAWYDNGRAEPKAVLAVGAGIVASILITVLITLPIMLGGIGGAVVIAVLVYLARRRARLTGMMVS